MELSFMFVLMLMTVLLIVLIVLVANLHTTVRSLRRDMTELMRQQTRPNTAQPNTNVPPSASQAAPPPPHGPTPPTNIQPQPAPAPRPHPQPASQPVPVQPAPQASPVAPPQGTPPRPQQSQPQPRPQPALAPEPRDSLENVLGTRVLAILAALLVFAGLVFLAILVVPTLSDQVRCAAMFVISAAITAAGLATNVHKKSPFSQALLGCGLGSVFVSMLVTYLYFGYLSDAPAAALMLVWLAATTFLSMQQKSVALAVIAQIGMAISVCFAYQHGVDCGQTPLVVGYQLMACVIVVAGCIRSSERWRTVGAFVPIATSLLVSQIVTSSYALRRPLFGWETYVAAMAAQLVVVTVLAHLTSIFASHSIQANDRKATAVLPHIAAEVIWLASVGINVCIALTVLRDGPLTNITASQAALAACGVIALHWAVTVVLEATQHLDKRLSSASVYLCAAACTVLLASRFALSFDQNTLPLVVLVAVALWLTGTVLRDEQYRLHAAIFVAIDALLMIAGGYVALNTWANAPVGPVYVLALNALAFAWHKSLGEERQRTMRGTLLVSCVVVTELSLGPAWDASVLSNPLELLATCATALLLVAALALADPQRRLELSPSIDTFLRINEFIVVAASCLFVVSRGPAYYADQVPAAAVAAVGASLVAVCIVVFRLAQIATRGNANPAWQQVIYGILLTVCTTSCALGILPSGMDALVTVCAMLSALACIGLGFARRLDALRLYGLVATLLCVFKIAIVDIRSADSMGRAIAFICGGIICFAISALYTFAVRRTQQGPKQ